MIDLIKKVIQETFSFGYGNNDYLSDLGNPDIKDKMGATAFQPDPVGVRMGLVNEFNEDLEYNHVDDATKDKYILTEKEKQTLKDYLKDIDEVLNYLEEDSFGGSELYTTDNLVGDISKPPHRQGYVDVEEGREKKYMDGSLAVDVKKQCRLAGLGNTSKACNQGEIENLTFKKINEKIMKKNNVDERGYNYKKIKDDYIKKYGKLPNQKETTPKEIKKEISHTIVELEEKSKERLLKTIEHLIPEDWKIIGDYILINMGEINKKSVETLSFKTIFYGIDYAKNDRVICVGIRHPEKLIIENEKPHIVIAVNNNINLDSKISKIKFLNDECSRISPNNYKPLKRPIQLYGWIKEIPYKI